MCLITQCDGYNTVAYHKSQEVQKVMVVKFYPLIDFVIEVGDCIRHTGRWKITKFVAIEHSDSDILEVEVQVYPDTVVS